MLVISDEKLAISSRVYSYGREGGQGRWKRDHKAINHMSSCFLVLVQKDDERYSIVEKTYREMHTKQTVGFVRGMVSQAQLAHQIQGLLVGGCCVSILIDGLPDLT